LERRRPATGRRKRDEDRVAELPPLTSAGLTEIPVSVGEAVVPVIVKLRVADHGLAVAPVGRLHTPEVGAVGDIGLGRLGDVNAQCCRLPRWSRNQTSC
jgi:hypothetical protein